MHGTFVQPIVTESSESETTGHSLASSPASGIKGSVPRPVDKITSECLDHSPACVYSSAFFYACSRLP